MQRATPRWTACLIAYACFSSAAALELGALRQRMRAVEAASVRERVMLERGSGAVPVIAFDALLPHQRLSLTVGDATFSKLLADLGLGGLLCVTSVDQRRRMLRRHGVLARLEHTLHAGVHARDQGGADGAHLDRASELVAVRVGRRDGSPRPSARD